MAASYNELMLEAQGWWKLQDNAASTTIVDSSGNSRNLTLNGAGNTSASSVAGPKPSGYLPNAIAFDGVNDYAMASSGPTLTLTSGSVLMWLRNTFTTTPNKAVAFGASSGKLYIYASNHSAQDEVAYNWSNATNQWTWVGGPSITKNTWTHVALTVNSTDGKMYTNSTIGGTNTLTHPSLASTTYNNVTLGRIPGSSAQYAKCEQADVCWFSRDLTADEIAEHYNGPEPLNTVAPSLSGTAQEGSTITSSTGSWDSQSNGSITYTYQWYSYTNTSGSGETLLSGATALTYVPVSGDVGKYLRCKIRGSNSGGYDAAEDTFSDYTAQVTASGGGGVTGTLAATEVGNDTVAISGSVLVSGTLTAAESGNDVVAIAGDVIVSGTLAATEVGSDVVAIAGTVGSTGVSGSLAAVEVGNDVVVIVGTVTGGSPGPVAGTLAVVEVGNDIVAISGQVLVSGTLAATEVGNDVVAIYSTLPVAGDYPMLVACKSRTLRVNKQRSLTATANEQLTVTK